MPTTITAYGETKSIAEWARDPRCKVGYLQLRNRLKAGMQPLPALTTSSKKEGTTVTIFSETKTIVEWSKDPRCQVSYSTILLRIRRGWSPVEAVATPK